LVGPELYLLFDFTKSYNYVLAAVAIPPLIVGNILLFLNLITNSTIWLISMLVIIFDIIIISTIIYVSLKFRRKKKRLK
jgi:hypothetical protein